MSLCLCYVLLLVLVQSYRSEAHLIQPCLGLESVVGHSTARSHQSNELHWVKCS